MNYRLLGFYSHEFMWLLFSAASSTPGRHPHLFDALVRWCLFKFKTVFVVVVVVVVDAWQPMQN